MNFVINTETQKYKLTKSHAKNPGPTAAGTCHLAAGLALLADWH